MIEIDGALQKMEGLVDFHEATWVYKRNGIYYLTYADNHGRENQLRYATSNNPLGPWKYQGVFLGSTDCDTNHGSVVEYKGKWYMFYHNQNILQHRTWQFTVYLCRLCELQRRWHH